ncbi:MAG: hypothetical protein ACC656_07660, partial [Candidatus Heimdallarchaeota archaeon]
MDVALPGSGPLKFSEMGEVVRGQTPGTEQKLSEIFVDAEDNKIWSPGDKVIPHNSSELYRYPKISDTFDWDPDLWACELREPLVPPIAFATSSGVITNGSAQIDGSTSYDPDGTIDIYAWRQISVSTTTVITDPTAAVTTVTGLNSEGLFIYELTVTDNDGLTDTDTTIIVGNICISAATPVVDDSGLTVTIYWKIVTTSGAFVNRDLVINAVINPGNDLVGFGIPAGSNSSNAT